MRVLDCSTGASTKARTVLPGFLSRRGCFVFSEFPLACLHPFICSESVVGAVRLAVRVARYVAAVLVEMVCALFLRISATAATDFMHNIHTGGPPPLKLQAPRQTAPPPWLLSAPRNYFADPRT